MEGCQHPCSAERRGSSGVVRSHSIATSVAQPSSATYVPEDLAEEDVGGDQADDGTIGGADEGAALITSYSLFG